MAFNQNAYAQQMQNKINSMYNAQKKAGLQTLKNQQARATGQINQQIGELNPLYASKRNQADVVSNQNMQALKEQMAVQGLKGSGENVTATVGQNNARLGALADLNMQQQQQTNDFKRRIADINDPGEEQALINQIEADRSRALYDAYNRADDVGYARSRDAIADKRYVDETNFNRMVTNRQWNQMSPAEKQQMALQYYYSQKGKKGSGGGGGGGRSSSSYSGGVTEKNPQLQIDPNKLYAIYDTLGKITPTYGSKGYYDKMNKLQY